MVIFPKKTVFSFRSILQQILAGKIRNLFYIYLDWIFVHLGYI